MAFSKTAKAKVTNPTIHKDSWMGIRAVSNKPSFDRRQAAQVVLDKYDANEFLLTHCTIVASVDTENPGAPLGVQMNEGMQINRKFADFYITPQTEKYINNNCFIPGTLVTMGDGTVRPIESVREGDLVYTHLGRVKRVTETFVRQVSEPILEVKPRGTTERLFVTSEHPFFVFRPVVACIHCGVGIHREHRCISHLLGKYYCTKDCYYAHRVANAVLLKSKVGEFVPARDLTNRDFVSTPVVKDLSATNLTPGQARLIGLFAAEGYYELDSGRGNEKVGVVWAFNKDERDTLANNVVKLLKLEFGVEGVIRKHSVDNGIHVTTRTNRELVKFFSQWIHGKGSKTKFLDQTLLTAERSVQLEVVRGWFEGDGCYVVTKVDSRLTATSSSRSLANQMQMILYRLGVSSHTTFQVTKGRRRLKVGTRVKVISDPSKECHSWSVTCGSGWVREIVEDTVYEGLYDTAVQKVPDLRFLNGYHLQIIEKVGYIDYTGPVYNFDVEDDHSYIANGVAVHNCDSWERKLLLATYRTFIGGDNFVEHVQIPALSKGKIIDAAARDIGESVYVDILIATDRKHGPLVNSIVSGELNTLSMGCTVSYTCCTKCGNVSEDETQLCKCIKYEKGKYFIDSFGRRRKIAELCGHVSDPESVKFIEGSWVANPAFEGAVLRSILDPKQAQSAGQKIQVAFSMPTIGVDPLATKKVANTPPRLERSSLGTVHRSNPGVGRKAVVADQLSSLYEGPSLGYLGVPKALSGEQSALNLKLDRLATIVGQQQDGGSQQEGQGQHGGEPKPEGSDNPFRSTIDTLYKSLVEEVSQKVHDDLSKAEKLKTEGILDENRSNESIIKSAMKYPKWVQRAKVVIANVKNLNQAQRILAGLILQDFGGWEAVKSANRFSGREILVIDKLLSRTTKKSSLAGDNRVYQTVIAVGGTVSPTNVNSYLLACQRVMGRTLTEPEKVHVLEKGRLFSLGV